MTLLYDARPARPRSAVGVGEFWYDPGVWHLPLSPASRVLYAGLCSFVGHGEVHRHDLRNTLKDCTDAEIAAAFEELVRHNLLSPESRGDLVGYAVQPVEGFEG